MAIHHHRLKCNGGQWFGIGAQRNLVRSQCLVVRIPQFVSHYILDYFQYDTAMRAKADLVEPYLEASFSDTIQCTLQRVNGKSFENVQT